MMIVTQKNFVAEFSSKESTYLPGRSYRVHPSPPQKKGPPPRWERGSQEFSP